MDEERKARELRAKELALECALLAFFIVALAGMLAGAENHIAVLRGLGAGALVAFAGRFPARLVLEAAEPSEETPEDRGRAPAAPAQPGRRGPRAA